MIREITLRLTPEDARRLAYLSASVGFGPETVAIYAVRLMSACMREGLFAEPFRDAWPDETHLPGLFDTGTGGKVLAFERNDAKEDGCV